MNNQNKKEQEWEARERLGEKPFDKPQQSDWEKTADIANKYGKDGCISALKEAIDFLLLKERKEILNKEKKKETYYPKCLRTSKIVDMSNCPFCNPNKKEQGWEKEFDEFSKECFIHFGGEGDEYNFYLDEIDEYEKLKSFISALLQQTREETLRSVLPKVKEAWDSFWSRPDIDFSDKDELTGMWVSHPEWKEQFWQDFEKKLKEKWGIKL